MMYGQCTYTVYIHKWVDKNQYKEIFLICLDVGSRMWREGKPSVWCIKQKFTVILHG